MLSKIIYAKKGCADMYAASLAKKALCLQNGQPGCTCASCRCMSHPDFLKLDGGLKENIDELLSFAKTPPMVADRRVVLLSDFDKILPITQTKLLKVLEEQPDFVLVANAEYENKVLTTIKSRTESIIIYPLSKKSFLEKGYSETCYYMTGGYEELAKEMKEQLPIYDALKSAYADRNEAEVFRILGLSEEKKGSKGYFENYPLYVGNLFDFLKTLPFRLLCDHTDGWQTTSEVIPVIRATEKEHDNYLESIAYSKTEFFSAVCRITDRLTNKGGYVI